jgi:hypothetical protein
MINLGLGIASRRRTTTPAAFTPASLFAGGEQGVLFDVSPANTGTSVGNPVSSLLDQSGRGNNATSSIAGSQPILRQSGALHYLEFDGINDWMQTAAIDLSASDALTVILGLRKLLNTPSGLPVEFSANAFSNAGAFYLAAPEGTGSGSDYRFYARGNAAPAAAVTSGVVLAPDTCVLTATVNTSANSRILRRNGVQVGSSTLAMGGGNWRSYPLYLGARAGSSLRFNGWIFGLIVINRQLSAAELAAAEAWMAAKTGVILT